MTAELATTPLATHRPSVRRRARNEHDGPWMVQDTTAAGGRLATSTLVTGICWFGASGTLLWRDQLLWTAGAVGAVVLGLSGVALYLLAGWRSVEFARKDVVLLLSQPPWAPAATPAIAVATATRRLVTASGMVRAHRADCALVAGKAVVEVADPDMPACRVCQP